MLAESNLDWGQDLPALARWQANHPSERLYLAYFGTADPASFGLRYINLPGGDALGPAPEVPKLPGVMAVSATLLARYAEHGVRMTRWLLYAPRRASEPLAVLHGSIYLFRFKGD